LANGALAIVVDDVVGIAPIGVDNAAPAAARFADDGEAAGCKPSAVGTCGVVCADGNVGSADRATTEVSAGISSVFHQAHRGPDWQPVIPMNAVAIANARIVVDLMFTQSRLESGSDGLIRRMPRITLSRSMHSITSTRCTLWAWHYDSSACPACDVYPNTTCALLSKHGGSASCCMHLDAQAD